MQKKQYFCSVKSRLKILLLLSLVALSLSSCHSFERRTRRLQRTLHEQQQRAEDLTEHLKLALMHNKFDSIWYYTRLDNNIVFYIYEAQQLVYWSDSWLSASDRSMRRVYDEWQYMQWDNAQGVCLRVQQGDYQIVVAIPIKYHYSLTSAQLHNSFIPPFRGDEHWNLSLRQPEGKALPVFSKDGAYLFSVENSAAAEMSDQQLEVIENFSYRSLLAENEQNGTFSRSKIRTYYLITFVLIGVFFIVSIAGLIRYRGFRRMRMGGKFQLVLTSTMVVILLSIFLVTIEHSRRVFIETQQLRLSKKAQYVQMALQNMYFWDVGISPANTLSLNIDLRDMSFAYETDIHVYDLRGRLIGTSTPKLFEMGLLPTHIAPEAFFSDVKKLVQYEHIGTVQYLSAYTEFVNGHYSKIGYIALPSFISQEEMTVHLQKIIMQILPLYILLFLGSILVVWIMSYRVTSSLSLVTKQLKKNNAGQLGMHIDYPYADEFGEMVGHYNQMMDALADSTERLARSEREMAWRTMARQVAHEINNPLTPMKLTLQQLQRTKGTDRFEDYFNHSTELLIDQIDTLSNIAQSFSSFAKMPEVTPTKVDVAAKLYDFVTFMSNNPDNVPIRYVGPEHGVLVMADAEQITQVFTNVVRNALQAMEGRLDSDIIIILKNASKSSMEDHHLDTQKRWVKISISDNGPGIPEEMIEKVFVPNFTTKNTGAGLGLSISKNIIEGSGGKIFFQTSTRGTTFFIYLQKV